MKYLFYILCLVGGTLNAQMDSITVPVIQIIKAAELIEDQRDTIGDLTRLSTEYIRQIELQSIMLRYDSTELSLLGRRVAISDGIIDRYQVHLEDDNKKWFNKPWVYFLGGFAAAWITTVMIKNIN